MVDREISAGAVVAYLLWALSLTLCAVAWVVGDLDVGRLSIILCGAAATATVRTYFVAQSDRIRAALIVAATEHPDGRVRPMH